MIRKRVLPNGLTLVSESLDHVRSVAVGVWLKRGSRHETARQSGISHFVEHMVFKGTRSRTAQQIAAEVDSIGGHMDAFTSKEYAAFHLKVLDQHLVGRDWMMGSEYTIADIAIWPWVNNLVGFYGAGELVGFADFGNVKRVLDAFLARPAVQRGLKIPARPAQAA